MKSLLTIALTVGFLASTSNAFCLKQFAKQQNRYSASITKNNFKPSMKSNAKTSTQIVSKRK